MGRKSGTVEFLERLVEWAGSRSNFVRRTGIAASSVSAYLAGTKPIAFKRLKNASEQLFGEAPAFVPILEGWDLFEGGRPSLSDIGAGPGLYALYDSAMRVIYFGKAANLYMEVRQTLGRHVAEVRPWTGAHNLRFVDIAYYLSAFRIERGDANFRHDVEVLVLRLLVNNTFNKKGGNFKRTS